MSHGWPGSIVEFHKIIRPLVDPLNYGGRRKMHSMLFALLFQDMDFLVNHQRVEQVLIKLLKFGIN